MYNDSCWVANVSDGSTHEEVWIPGELSPWRRLIAYCEATRSYITALRMTVGNRTVACPSGAMAYWQANAMPSIQGIECDEELHKWHGIGWVDPLTLRVKIIWGAMDPKTHDVAFWNDERDAETQTQIIWAKPTLILDPENPITKVDEPVKGVKEYMREIDLAEHGPTE